MTTFRTMNPIGSTAAKDLSDNAENLDKFANGDDYEYDDRLGRSRKSLKWIEDAALAIPAIEASQRSEQQAERSAAEAERSISAKTEAEAARDAAQLSAGVYVDTATGLAATAENRYFSVPSANSSEYLILYQNQSGVAVEIKRYPSVEAVRGSYEGVASTVRNPGKKVAYSRPITGRYTLVSGGVAWGVGFFPASDLISRVSAKLVISALVTKARVRVYQRNNAASFVTPGTSGVDTLLREVVIDLSGQGVSIATVTRTVQLEAVFDPLYVSRSLPIMVTIAAMDATDAEAVCGIGTAAYVSGSPTVNQGYIKSAGGNYNLLGATQPWPAITIDDGATTKPLTVPVSISDIAYYPTTDTSWNRADFSGWATNFPGSPGVTFDTVVGNLGLIAQNEYIQVRVYSRLVSAVSDVSPPGAQVADLHMATRKFRAADIASSDALTKVSFPMGIMQLAADRFAVVDILSIKADGTKGVLGAGRAVYTEKPVQNTWMVTAAGTPGFAVLSQNNAVSIGIAVSARQPLDVVMSKVIADTSGVKSSVAQQQIEIASANARIDDIAGQVVGAPQPGVSDILTPKLTITGRAISLAGSYATLDGVTTAFSGSFTLARPASGTEVKTGYTLKYAPSGATLTANTNSFLWRRRLSGVVVTRQSDGVVLTEGTDYGVDYLFGKLYGKVNTADFLVDVSYTYQRERYDLLQIDLTTLVASVVMGTERDMDAPEFGPDKGDRSAALYMLYVREDTVTAVPVYKFEKGVRKDSQAAFTSVQANNKMALTKTLAKLRKGSPIKMVGYGHSIVAHGSYDLLWYFEAMDGTTRNAIPRYDRGDSGGPWAVKTSYLWVAKQALEGAFGVTIDYVNYGKPGTNSSGGANQGLDPARLGPVLASGADLMILDFAMNEIGADTTYANFKSIIMQAKAAGMDVVVMACQQTNKQTDTRDIAGWRKTNRTLQQVASDTGVAFCPTHWLTDQGGGGVPIAPEQLCAANFFNHPGITENRVYGELLARTFL